MTQAHNHNLNDILLVIIIVQC